VGISSYALWSVHIFFEQDKENEHKTHTLFPQFSLLLNIFLELSHLQILKEKNDIKIDFVSILWVAKDCPFAMRRKQTRTKVKEQELFHNYIPAPNDMKSLEFRSSRFSVKSRNYSGWEGMEVIRPPEQILVQVSETTHQVGLHKISRLAHAHRSLSWLPSPGPCKRDPETSWVLWEGSSTTPHPLCFSPEAARLTEIKCLVGVLTDP
jgi:hypothetical protein